MSANLEAKKVVVSEIKDKIARAKSIAVVNYNGLNVEEDTAMRKAFRESGSEYKVYKNRLMLIALNEMGFKGLEKDLEGTNAIAFGFEDVLAPAKVICNTIDKTKKMEIKFGIVDGKIVDKAVIETYAKIPSKEVLIAQLLSVLNGPARNLACALNQIAEKQQA